MRDKTFFVYGIRDWLQNFAGCGIQIEQTAFGIRDMTKNQLRDAGYDLIFSRDTGSIHLHRGPQYIVSFNSVMRHFGYRSDLLAQF